MKSNYLIIKKKKWQRAVFDVVTLREFGIRSKTLLLKIHSQTNKRYIVVKNGTLVDVNQINFKIGRLLNEHIIGL